MNRSLSLVIALAAIATAPAWSQAAHDHTHTARATAAVDASATEGEVRKIDKTAGKITLKHGPIKNLDMPAMTMVFTVKDPTLLDKAKAGDKVKFTADKVGEQLRVTSLETQR